jgi:hypothetical protein
MPGIFLILSSRMGSANLLLHHLSPALEGVLAVGWLLCDF